MGVWQKVTLVLRVGATAFAGLVTLTAALRALGLFTTTPPALDTWAWVIALIIIGVDNVATLFTRSARAKKAARNAAIETTLMGLLISLARSGDMRFEELGASVFVPSAWDRFLRRGAKARKLKRIVRFRPSGYPQQSGVRWTPEKGAVGECWTRQRSARRDWNAVARRWGGDEVSEERFKQIPPGTREGFEYDEFTRIAGKYSEIVAEPIWHTGKERLIIGVLAIDRSYLAEDASFKAHLTTSEKLQIAAATASTVGGILSSKADGA